MTRYSVQPRDRIFVKKYGFLNFARNMEAKFDLIYGKITDEIKKVSKTSPQNSSVTIKEEILRERCLSPSERQKKQETRTQNWVEANDGSQGTYIASNQIKFKNSMIGQIYRIVLKEL